MRINLTLTRRTAVLGVATLVAVGGAVAIGLSGNSAAPTANARTTGTAILAPALAGATIPAAAAAGGDATQISGLSTDLENNSGPLNQARDAAFNDAKAKATQYAKSAGRTLGPVVRVEETVSTQPNGAVSADSAKSAASGGSIAPVPIQMGSTDVTVQVTVVFSFS